MRSCSPAASTPLVRSEGAECRAERPSHRTFTQEDPISLAGGLNLYGFAGGDPVNFSDPFGLCPPEDDVPCPQGTGDGVGPQATEVTSVTVLFGFGQALGLSFGIAHDSNGDVALFASVLGGAGLGAGVGVAKTIQAGTVDDLRARSSTMGFDAAEATEMDVSIGPAQMNARLGPHGSARGSGIGTGFGFGWGAWVTQATTALHTFDLPKGGYSVTCVRTGICQ